MHDTASPDAPHPGHTQPGLPVPAPSPAPGLRGTASLDSGGLLDYATALVQSPGSIVEDLHRPRATVLRLTGLVLATMSITGLVVAAFSGGLQFVWVPIKLSVGMLVCALLCLPSLYIFSSLSGATQSLRETTAALLMCVGLIGVLLVGLSPVSWLFSQTTSSPAVMGCLHVAAVVISSAFGLGLLRRVLAALNGGAFQGLRGWGLMFVLVLLQMSTTLRPLVGPYEGQLLGSKKFFVEHWGQVVGSRPATTADAR